MCPLYEEYALYTLLHTNSILLTRKKASRIAGLRELTYSLPNLQTSAAPTPSEAGRLCP